MFQTLLGDSGTPSPTSSPWIRLYPQPGFGREAQDELPRLSRARGPAWRPRRIAPAAADEPAMRAKQRRRLDQKRLPPRSRQNPAQRRQQGAVGRPEPRASDLALEHVQLMPKDEDLHLLRPFAATTEHEQLEQATKRP
jgi:hypothetical protein